MSTTEAFEILEDAVWCSLVPALDILDPEQTSEAWRFTTEALLPTIAVQEDIDLADSMMAEAILLIHMLSDIAALELLLEG